MGCSFFCSIFSIFRPIICHSQRRCLIIFKRLNLYIMPKQTFSNRLIKVMVLLLSILTANLVTTWIDNFMLSFKHQYSPYIFTALGMSIVVLIYYPLFTKIDKWSSKYANHFVRHGKKLVKSEIGTLVTFFIALSVLFYFYGKLWFNKNVFVDLFHVIF